MRREKLRSAGWLVNLYPCMIFLMLSSPFKNLLLSIQEEEAEARKAKEEETAALEFEKWKDEFSVDAEGTTENEMQAGGEGLLSNFVEYIKVFPVLFHLKC